MIRQSTRLTSALRAVLAGAVLLQLGPCTTNDLRTQLATGLRTALNGLFNIAVTQFSNDVLDVDD